MIHIREQETQPSCSDVLIKAFSSFINTINEQRAPYTLNGLESIAVRNIVRLLERLYKEEIKHAHFLASEDSISHYVNLLKKGDLAYN
jgi:hypothetical protein